MQRNTVLAFRFDYKITVTEELCSRIKTMLLELDLEPGPGKVRQHESHKNLVVIEFLSSDSEVTPATEAMIEKKLLKLQKKLLKLYEEANLLAWAFPGIVISEHDLERLVTIARDTMIKCLEEE